MAKRMRYQTQPSLLPRSVREDDGGYNAGSVLASTPAEIRLAVETNAVDRGILLVRVIASLQIDSLLSVVEEYSRSYDEEDYYQFFHDEGVPWLALDLLKAAHIPFPRFFALPSQLIESSPLVFYYRNVAMLSRKVMGGIGLDTGRFENGFGTPSPDEARLLATYFNRIVSGLVQAAPVSHYRHVELLMANVGDGLGGTSRNEVGRVAMERLMRPLIARLFRRGSLQRIVYSLKGRPDEDDSQEISQVLPAAEISDIEDLLQRFAEQRVKYHQIDTHIGNSLLFDRQLRWLDSRNQEFRIGPDLHSRVDDIDMAWAAEVKGGADPAGSDEHWKTATEALDRIIRAAEATGRPTPKLSFIATILVERVARDVEDWIRQGKLTTAYNLTRLLHDEHEMDKFLQDMEAFLGLGL